MTRENRWDVAFVLLLAVAGAIAGFGTGYYAGYDYGQGTVQDMRAAARQTGYDRGYEAGFQNGSDSALKTALPIVRNESAAVVFRQDPGNNRTVAYTYPAVNATYQCSVDKKDAWKIGEFTWLYNSSTSCEFTREDVTRTWDAAGVETVNLYQQYLERLNTTASDETAPNTTTAEVN